MKKNVLIKGILILVVVALLAIGFSGCYPAPPIITTGTVYLYVGGWYWYDLYMDYMGKFWGVPSVSTHILYNVPIGWHYFEAVDIDGPGWGYDDTTQYITAGNNYVYLYP
jgi:hypothetical protein